MSAIYIHMSEQPQRVQCKKLSIFSAMLKMGGTDFCELFIVLCLIKSICSPVWSGQYSIVVVHT